VLEHAGFVSKTRTMPARTRNRARNAAGVPFRRNGGSIDEGLALSASEIASVGPD